MCSLIKMNMSINKKIKLIIFVSAVLFSLIPLNISYSADTEAKTGYEEYDYTEDLEQFDFHDIDEIINNAADVSDVSFSSMVTLLIEGKFDKFLKETGNYIIDILTSEIKTNKDIFWQVIVIAAVSALFTNFADSFENGQVGETGFFVSYLIISTLLMTSFMTVYSLVSEVIEFMVEFIMALIPSFYLAVIFTGRSMASMAFYELTVAAAGVVEWLFLKILLPVVKVYIAFVTANNMTKEGQLDKLCELTIKIVSWISKSLFGIVIGISVIQNMVLPYADAVKTSVLTKTLSALPGVGGAIDSAAGLIFGTANLIKNGIGTAALVFLAVICLVPVVKVFIINLIIQGSAAIVQPVADKRITNIITAYAEGIKVLLMLVFYTAALFMVIIAMVCAFTAPAS